MLMYEYEDMSPLLNQLGKYDPLLHRSEAADEMAIFYYVSSDISEEIKKRISDTAYGEVLCQKGIIEKLNDDKALKAHLFNVLVRIESIMGAGKKDSIYEQYIRDLYYYNLGKIPKLSVIFRVTFIVKLIVTCHFKSDRSPWKY